MRRVLLTLFALFVIVGIGALWYASHQGFTSKWRRYVSEEFRKRGMEITLRRLTLDPVRGLVAKEVHVYDARDRRRTLAVIDEMALQVNFANLVRGKTFLDALDLHDASLSLPINPEKPQGEKIEIEHLNARLFLPPQQVYLAYAEADIFGLHVSASGRLIHPQAFRSLAKSREAFSPEVVARFFEEISALKFEGEPPVLGLTFSGDLAEPEQIYVDLALWAERIRHQKYLLKNLYVSASWRGGALDLKQLVATDAAGELRLSGLWETASQHVQLQLRSDIDAAGLARELGNFGWLDDFVFYAPPAVDLRLNMTLGEKPAFLVTGEVSAKKFAYRSVVFEHAGTGFSWDGTRWSLRDARLVRSNGEQVSGDALQLAGDFRARLESTLSPKVLRPLVPDGVAEMLAQFEFSQPPHLTLETRGASPSLDGLRAEGELALGHASFRGVGAESAGATLSYENRVLSFAPFHVERTEGSASGNLRVDFPRDEIRFESVQARLNPPEAAMWIDPRLVSDILPYHFVRQPPHLLIDGPLSLADGKATHLTIQVDAPAGMDYTLLNKNVSVTQLRGKLLLTGDRLEIPNFSAALFGGDLTGDADISLARGNMDYRADAALANADGASLAKFCSGSEGAQGHVNGRYECTGRGDDARTMQGRGEISLTEGNLAAIPFLSPFSSILDGIAPGLSRDVARQASATFHVADGAITTNDLAVQGNGFRLLGSGKLSFLEDKMDFDLGVAAQGLSGLLLSPVSQLFQYTADQKLSRPQWRLKLIPRVN